VASEAAARRGGVPAGLRKIETKTIQCDMDGRQVLRMRGIYRPPKRDSRFRIVVKITAV